MPQKNLGEVLQQTKQYKNNSVIQKILGRNKFIMLNAIMLKKLGPNAACFLTFILDRADFLEQSNQIDSVEEDGLFLYRADITEKVGISPYTQRQVEKQLADLEIMVVVEEKLRDNQTRNRYYINLEKLDIFVELEY